MTTRQQTSGLRRWTAVLLALACASAPIACGDGGDDGQDGSGGGNEDEGTGGNASDGTGGNDGTGGGNDGTGGRNDGGQGGEGGADPGPGVTSWIVGNWSVDTEGNYLGALTVVDDLSAESSVSLDNAEDFGTDIFYTSAGDGVVFVGRDGETNIQRFQADSDGSFELTGELGLSAYGVTSTLGRSLPVVQVIDEERAYYIDIENFQVIVFNPSSTPMTIYEDETFDFGELEVGELWGQVGTLVRDDDRVIVVGRYWDADDTTTPLVKAAIIDTESNDVTYIEDTRCSNAASAIVDPEGNIYFGSHPGLGVAHEAGLEDSDSTPPCIIRIQSGESEFDENYFVDLESVAGRAGVGTLLQGVDGHAYVMQYDGEDDITPENSRDAMLGAYFRLHVFELDSVEDTYALVDGMPLAPGYNSSFTTTVGHREVTYLVLPGDNFVGGYYWDVTDPFEPERALEFPGYPGEAIPLN